ncbi:MAG TPA: gamma-glutamyltransferase [Trueperaceae bacterium]
MSETDRKEPSGPGRSDLARGGSPTASSPTANAAAGAHSFSSGGRPTVLAPRAMVSTGHYLASAAALDVLQRGGNAVDAGVAAGLTLNVVHTDMNTLSGVAPIALAVDGRVATIAGIGTWPAAVTAKELRERFGGIPNGVERCVVPGAAAAWLTALRDYGTMSFAEVSAAARRYAAEGFPVHTFMRHAIGSFLHVYRRYPENARLYLVDGEPPAVGTLLRQPELAATLEELVAAEARAAGREAGIDAALDHFYRGPIAHRMAAYMREHGGYLRYEDLALYQVEVAPPVSARFGELEVLTCGPWSQGPSLALALGILREFDLAALGHNSAGYVNVVASALDLAFADRNAHLGDPRHRDVPLAELTSDDYLRSRAALVPSAGSAFASPPPPGDPRGGRAEAPELARHTEGFGVPASRPPADTSCVTVVDADGNLFAATPSDGYSGGPVIPGLGLHVSERGAQSFLEDDDPNVVAPGKRPRLTPNPVLVLRDGRPLMAMASPGNDRQVQAMLQVLLNLFVFGMTPQEAVEAPRFASYNFRASSWPGNLEPGLLALEEGIPDATVDALRSWGRDVRRWPHWCWSAGGVCLSLVLDNGVRAGAADPRRESYAVGT